MKKNSQSKAWCKGRVGGRKGTKRWGWSREVGKGNAEVVCLADVGKKGQVVP